MKIRDFWHIPRTLEEAIHNRSVTFLELFYDLVFVVYIASINHALLHHFTLEGFLEFAVLFVIGWWSWNNGATYHELHGNDDVRSRYFTFLQMLFIMGLSIFAPTAFTTGYVGFSVSFMLLNLVIGYLWFMIGVIDQNHRKMSNPYTAFIVLIILFFLVEGQWEFQ